MIGLLITGCENKYYYSEGKTIDQTKADWQQCYADVINQPTHTYSYDYGDIQQEQAQQCMREKGYDTYPASRFDEHVKVEEGFVNREPYWIAGEK